MTVTRLRVLGTIQLSPGTVRTLLQRDRIHNRIYDALITASKRGLTIRIMVKAHQRDLPWGIHYDETGRNQMSLSTDDLKVMRRYLVAALGGKLHAGTRDSIQRAVNLLNEWMGVDAVTQLGDLAD